ncbi:hypothetical protein P9112_002768 [Eukaryota sp. TZLM1-RC]
MQQLLFLLAFVCALVFADRFDDLLPAPSAELQSLSTRAINLPPLEISEKIGGFAIHTLRSQNRKLWLDPESTANGSLTLTLDGGHTDNSFTPFRDSSINYTYFIGLGSFVIPVVVLIAILLLLFTIIFIKALITLILSLFNKNKNPKYDEIPSLPKLLFKYTLFLFAFSILVAYSGALSSHRSFRNIIDIYPNLDPVVQTLINQGSKSYSLSQGFIEIVANFIDSLWTVLPDRFVISSNFTCASSLLTDFPNMDPLIDYIDYVDDHVVLDESALFSELTHIYGLNAENNNFSSTSGDLNQFISSLPSTFQNSLLSLGHHLSDIDSLMNPVVADSLTNSASVTSDLNFISSSALLTRLPTMNNQHESINLIDHSSHNTFTSLDSHVTSVDSYLSSSLINDVSTVYNRLNELGNVNTESFRSNLGNFDTANADSVENDLSFINNLSWPDLNNLESTINNLEAEMESAIDLTVIRDGIEKVINGLTVLDSAFLNNFETDFNDFLSRVNSLVNVLPTFITSLSDLDTNINQLPNQSIIKDLMDVVHSFQAAVTTFGSNFLDDLENDLIIVGDFLNNLPNVATDLSDNYSIESSKLSHLLQVFSINPQILNNVLNQLADLINGIDCLSSLQSFLELIDLEILILPELVMNVSDSFSNFTGVYSNFNIAEFESFVSYINGTDPYATGTLNQPEFINVLTLLYELPHNYNNLNNFGNFLSEFNSFVTEYYSIPNDFISEFTSFTEVVDSVRDLTHFGQQFQDFNTLLSNLPDLNPISTFISNIIGLTNSLSVSDLTNIRNVLDEIINNYHPFVSNPDINNEIGRVLALENNLVSQYSTCRDVLLECASNGNQCGSHSSCDLIASALDEVAVINPDYFPDLESSLILLESQYDSLNVELHSALITDYDSYISEFQNIQLYPGDINSVFDFVTSLSDYNDLNDYFVSFDAQLSNMFNFASFGSACMSMQDSLLNFPDLNIYASSIQKIGNLLDSFSWSDGPQQTALESEISNLELFVFSLPSGNFLKDLVNSIDVFLLSFPDDLNDLISIGQELVDTYYSPQLTDYFIGNLTSEASKIKEFFMDVNSFWKSFNNGNYQQWINVLAALDMFRVLVSLVPFFIALIPFVIGYLAISVCKTRRIFKAFNFFLVFVLILVSIVYIPFAFISIGAVDFCESFDNTSLVKGLPDLSVAYPINLGDFSHELNVNSTEFFNHFLYCESDSELNTGFESFSDSILDFYIFNFFNSSFLGSELSFYESLRPLSRVYADSISLWTSQEVKTFLLETYQSVSNCSMYSPLVETISFDFCTGFVNGSSLYVTAALIALISGLFLLIYGTLFVSPKKLKAGTKNEQKLENNRDVPVTYSVEQRKIPVNQVAEYIPGQVV